MWRWFTRPVDLWDIVIGLILLNVIGLALLWRWLT